MVSSYLSLPWRLIICTSKISEELVNNLHQKLVPVRGQEQGEFLKNKRIYNLKNKISKYSQLTKFSQTHYMWVGGLLGLIALGILSSVPYYVHAQSKSWNNIEAAKKAIASVAPVVNDPKPETQTQASLVFSSDAFIQKPLMIETKITKEEVVKPVRRAVTTVAMTFTNGNHNFPYGYCTYYVSQKRNVAWSGNAITWLANARAVGQPTGNEPKAGAIIVTSEGGRTGHVGYVEAVDGDKVTISEMNFSGFGRISTRTISASYGVIRGYIY